MRIRLVKDVCYGQHTAKEGTEYDISEVIRTEKGSNVAIVNNYYGDEIALVPEWYEIVPEKPTIHGLHNDGKIRWLSCRGFLTIRNSSAGAYLTDHLMRWTVMLEIRVPGGTTLHQRNEDLNSAIDLLYKEAVVWMLENKPEYIVGDENLEVVHMVANLPELTFTEKDDDEPEGGWFSQ